MLRSSSWQQTTHNGDKSEDEERQIHGEQLPRGPPRLHHLPQHRRLQNHHQPTKDPSLISTQTTHTLAELIKTHYHGAATGGAVHQAGGGVPAAASREAVDAGDGERPLEEELPQDGAFEEAGLLPGEVVAVLGGVPEVEADERGRKPVGGEAGLRVEERGGDGDDEEVEEEELVGEVGEEGRRRRRHGRKLVVDQFSNTKLNYVIKSPN